MRYGADDLVTYVGLAAALMILIDRLAALSDGISGLLLRDGRLSAPTDPIARDFARVRREEAPLSVGLVSFSEPRPSSRRLARVVRAVLPYLRVTDAVVRLAGGGVVVVLPGADARVAASVLGRALAAEPPGLLLGVATFPEDGQTFAVLKDVARSRQRPWPGDAGPRTREPRRSPAPQPVERRERPPSSSRRARSTCRCGAPSTCSSSPRPRRSPSHWSARWPSRSSSTRPAPR